MREELIAIYGYEKEVLDALSATEIEEAYALTKGLADVKEC